LTPYLRSGDNVIAIRLDNPPDSSRWYPGGGIYRNVWLVKTSPLHVGHWGTYITTREVSPASASVELKITLENSSTVNARAEIRSQLFAVDRNGQKAAQASATFPPARIDLAGGGRDTATTLVRIEKPKLWSLKNPNQYVVVTTVSENG